ncbi:MAG: hypothetical protein ABSB76_39040 [Streptosporangiaceae bacterium]|jgi:hypothetical protein
MVNPQKDEYTDEKRVDMTDDEADNGVQEEFSLTEGLYDGMLTAEPAGMPQEGMPAG